MKPMSNSSEFKIIIITDCDKNGTAGVMNLDSIMAMPLTPPVAKLLGPLKKKTPAAKSIIPKLSIIP